MLLDNKIVVVTGGGGGIGGAIAMGLLKNGAKTCIVDYSKKSLDQTLKKLINGGSDVLGLKADIAKPKDVGNAFDAVSRKWGGIDVLVNAAGIQGPIGILDRNRVEDWIKTIEINLLGTYFCMQAALPGMVKKGSGKIINFSGGGATSPRVRFSAYAAAKTAVVRMTEIAAEEYKSYHIDINSIAPGAVNTGMLDAVLEAGGEAAGSEYDESVRRKEKGGTPPERAAELVVFLASEASNGITGKLISAPWDPWKDEAFQERLKNEKDLATLRRIDDKMFFKK